VLCHCFCVIVSTGTAPACAHVCTHTRLGPCSKVEV